MKLNNLVEHLRVEAKVQGLTQAELAHRSGLSPAQISRIFKLQSTPSLDALYGIARALNKPMDQICEWAGVTPPRNANPIIEEIGEIAKRLLEPTDLLDYARMRLRVQEERRKK